jgi:hypothetical protein
VVIAAPVIYRKEYAEFITPAYQLTDKEQTEKAGQTSVDIAEKQYRRDSLAIARGMAAEIKAVTHKIGKEKRVIPAKWKPEYQEAVANNRRVSNKITAAVSEIKAIIIIGSCKLGRLIPRSPAPPLPTGTVKYQD